MAVGSAEEALEVIRQQGVPDVALVDLDLPGMDGLQLIRRLEKENPQVYSVLITAASPERVQALRQEESHAKYLRKPLSIDDLLTLLTGNHHPDC
jgi:CheY-like chemotaxis protein